jgi:sirohydrochlorin ferrochelatase
MSNAPEDAAADHGLLLLGHGTREAIGIREFHETVELVARLRSDQPVEGCFLELAEPSIAAGFRTLASRGGRRITVVPVLLFAAGHAERDIPQAVAAVAAEFPTIGVEQCPHLGCHDALLALSQTRYQKAIAGRPTADKTALVMVGRGSHHAGATAEMHEFVRRRVALTPGVEVRTAFVAMAEPPLEQVLKDLAGSDCTRVVVQPHLLFGGVLLDRIAATVADFARRHPDRDWVVAPHLGPHALLAQAIASRAAGAPH